MLQRQKHISATHITSTSKEVSQTIMGRGVLVQGVECGKQQAWGLKGERGGCVGGADVGREVGRKRQLLLIDFRGIAP